MFTNYLWHCSALKIEADEKLADDTLFVELRVDEFPIHTRKFKSRDGKKSILPKDMDLELPLLDI